MTESSVCCGCFVNHPTTWGTDQFKSYIGPEPNYVDCNLPPIFIQESNGLVDEEKACLAHLANAWNSFQQLTGKHPSDDVEFCKAIHDAQKMIALRVARRIDKEVWKQYE